MDFPTGGDEFDFVIIGSGAGGGPLAANLAEAGFTVCVLEAGGPPEPEHSASANKYDVPVFHPQASEDPTQSWKFFVKHYSDPLRQQADTKFDQAEQGIFYPRASTLGGCTAHHALITVYPHNSDWDEIAELTKDPTWHSSQMRSYFERLEKCVYYPQSPFRAWIIRLLESLHLRKKNAARHGYKGWLTTSMADPTLALGDYGLLRILKGAIKEAWINVGGTFWDRIVSDFDPNDWRLLTRKKDRQGVAFTPLSVREGRRHGVRERLLDVHRRHPDRLFIRTHTLATKVLFDGEAPSLRAVGVQFLKGARLYRAVKDAPPPQGQGDSGVVRARREVILSGGAFNTPQLLLLSGIGPKRDLDQWNIPCQIDLPGVGKNLQDRYEVGIISSLASNFEILKGATFKQDPNDPHWVEWDTEKKGVYASNGVVLGIILKSKADLLNPDLYIFGVPGYFKGYFVGYSKNVQKDKFTWAILKAHTHNTDGFVTLRSTDPRDVPEIHFRYFDEGSKGFEKDLEAIVKGVKFVRHINQLAGDAISEELWPGANTTASDEDLRSWIKREAWGHHASCTSKMGPVDDPLTVVDSQFKVRGTKNLRVVDASIFPKIPGMFIVCAVYMVSEKASDVIIAEHRIPEISRDVPFVRADPSRSSVPRDTSEEKAR